MNSSAPLGLRCSQALHEQMFPGILAAPERWVSRCRAHVPPWLRQSIT